jgi:hypothetical protein
MSLMIQICCAFERLLRERSEALCYWPKGRGFDSRYGNGSGIDSSFDIAMFRGLTSPTKFSSIRFPIFKASQNNIFLKEWVGRSTPNPHLEEQNVPFLIGSLPLTRLSWEALPVVMYCQHRSPAHVAVRASPLFQSSDTCGRGQGWVVDSAPKINEYQVIPSGVKVAGTYGWQPYHLHLPKV